MAIALTDLNDLIAPTQQQGEPIYRPLEFGSCLELPEPLGKGCKQTFYLRDGLTVEIRQGILYQPLRYLVEHESRFPLVAKFYLSGSSRVRTLDASDIDRDYREVDRQHYLYHLPEHTEIEEWPDLEAIDVVMVFADPDYFSRFHLGKTVLSKPLQKLFEGDRSQRFHQPLGHMTPMMVQLVRQISQCPYTGLMQQLYLESKALELLALQFATWTETPRSRREIALSPRDIEQLHQAKDILVRQVKHPPSLTELARLVGLNDRKLKQGFRQLFGTTVFGYLCDYRMQQARDLLHEPDSSVARVAATVGYRNPEAFSTAFRRKFAISPKAYQIGQRG